MTLPPDPTLFLAHCKAHKSPTQSQPCKELKMPTHNPPTPADEYLSSLIQHFSNISFFSDQAHHLSTHRQPAFSNLLIESNRQLKLKLAESTNQNYLTQHNG